MGLRGYSIKYSKTGGYAMKIINLTPHELNLIIGDKEIRILPSGIIARCEVTRQQIDSIIVDSVEIPINKAVFGKVENLPEPQDNTIYVVSSLVAQAVPHRNDVFVPDDTVRDDQGRIIGARALARV